MTIGTANAAASPGPSAFEVMKSCVDKGDYAPLDQLRTNQFSENTLTEAVAYAAGKKRAVTLIAHLIGSGIEYEYVKSSTFKIGVAGLDLSNANSFVRAFFTQLDSALVCEDAIIKVRESHAKAAIRSGAAGFDVAEATLFLIAAQAITKGAIKRTEREAAAKSSSGITTGSKISAGKVDFVAGLVNELTGRSI